MRRAKLKKPVPRWTVELALRATVGRWHQPGEDSANAIITAIEGMRWALGESEVRGMQKLLRAWAAQPGITKGSAR